MNKCFLVCLFALILQSVHEQFVDLICKKIHGRKYILEVVFSALCWLWVSCPCFSWVLIVISWVFLVFNCSLVRIPWKDLACPFLANRSSCSWVSVELMRKAFHCFSLTTPFSLFPSTVNPLVSKRESHEAFGKAPAVLGKLLCWWTQSFQIHLFPLPFLPIPSAHSRDPQDPSGFADLSPVSCSTTEPCQGTSVSIHLFRCWFIKEVGTIASHPKYASLRTRRSNLFGMAEMKENEVTIRIFMLCRSEWSKMSEALKFSLLL